MRPADPELGWREHRIGIRLAPRMHDRVGAGVSACAERKEAIRLIRPERSGPSGKG